MGVGAGAALIRLVQDPMGFDKAGVPCSREVAAKAPWGLWLACRECCLHRTCGVIWSTGRTQVGHHAMRTADLRAPTKVAISMENAQQGALPLVISPSYPRQTLSGMCVQWPSRARDACAKPPVPRRDFPPLLRAPLMAFSSKGWSHLVPNDWR